ncbi:MAG: hypothetical protein ACLUW6_01380 [Coriobacteriaceae bacterium]
MTFQKVSAEEAAKIKEDAASMEGIQTREMTLLRRQRSDLRCLLHPVTAADDDMWTIDVVAKKSDEWGGSGYVADVNNKSTSPST